MKTERFLLMLWGGVLLPFLSVTSSVAQNPARVGEIGGHEYVDLGLPSGTLWATCNLGASTPYEAGPYFAWGEVEPKEYFSWENYAYYLDFIVDYDLGAWCELEDIGQDICGTQYDAARQIWGNGWRMPNEQERYELRMYCWNEWVTENGMAGVRVHGPNGNSIFLPACGYGAWGGDTGPVDVGLEGGYWTGVEAPENTFDPNIPIEPSNRAKCLYVYNAGLESSHPYKFGGKNIRPVFNPRESGLFMTENRGLDLLVRFRDGVLSVSDRDASCQVCLYDLSGRLVFSGRLSGGACQLPALSGGVYLVSLSDEDTVLIKQKILIHSFN